MRILQPSALILAVATSAAGCAGADGATPAESTAALSSDSISASSDDSGPVCRIVLEKIRPGESESRVYSRDCYDSHKEMSSAKKIEPFSSTLLMTWYVDANYRGRSTFIEGKDGACDHDGYGVRNVDGWAGGWNDVISSFKSWNHCNYVVGYTDINYGGHSQTWFNANGVYEVDALDVGYVGAAMNDKISSFRLSQE
jgi:hypothetical protein